MFIIKQAAQSAQYDDCCVRKYADGNSFVSVHVLEDLSLHFLMVPTGPRSEVC